MAKPYFESDHFIGGGPEDAGLIRVERKRGCLPIITLVALA